MVDSARDPLWISYPSWLEESGLPGLFAETLGLEAWVLFRKLVELDCERNITPDWFSCSHETLARWTGISLHDLPARLEQLERGGWIERSAVDEFVENVRILTPFPYSIDEAKIRSRLAGRGTSTGRFLLRYLVDPIELNQVEKVVYLYQMIFGLRFTPRIAEDLEEIANTYDMGLIYSVFSEAYMKKIKTLAWIRAHLARQASDASPPAKSDSETGE